MTLSPGAVSASCSLSEEKLTDVYGTVYFKLNNGSFTTHDNTFGCWSTNVLYAVALLYAAWYLAGPLSRRRHLKPIGTWANPRSYFTGALLNLALAVFAAALHHAACPSAALACFGPTWKGSMVFQAAYALCSCLAGFHVLAAAFASGGAAGAPRPLRALFFSFTAAGYAGLAVAQAVVFIPFILQLFFASFVPTIFLFLAVWALARRGRRRGPPRPAPAAAAPAAAPPAAPLPAAGPLSRGGGRRPVPLFALGLGLGLLGMYLQATTKPACNGPCPADCAWPVPHLNHNTVLHLFSLAGLAPVVLSMDWACGVIEADEEAAARGEKGPKQA